VSRKYICWRVLRCSLLLRSDFCGQHIGAVPRVQDTQTLRFRFLNPEDGTDRLSPNVGNKLPLLVAHGRRHTRDFIPGSYKRRWAIFYARPRTRATVSSHKHWFSYVMDCKDIALVCALLLRKRNVKKRKKFCVIQQRVKGYLKENSTPYTKN